MKNKNNIEHRAETTLNLRLSKSEKEHLKQAASAAGESITNYIRLCCQLIPAAYAVTCEVRETGEEMRLTYPPDWKPYPGDLLRVSACVDDCGPSDCMAVVKTVTPLWETVETLRQRLEPLIL